MNDVSKNINETEYWALIKEIGSFNEKWDDSVITKADIFRKLILSLNTTAKTVLFTQFNPVALYLSKFYDVTVICPSDLSNVFDMSNIKIVDSVTSKYDIVLALDEFLTYGDGEQLQRDKIEDIAKVTNGWLITTLQDYKNFAPHKKNQINAMSISSNHNYIMLENSIADKLDKQIWSHYWLCVKDHQDLLSFGPVTRRTMYFKQLAKYSSDAGSKQYVIQKNLLYKGFFSKNFEHIITVNFG
jgi:hypothetical protein